MTDKDKKPTEKPEEAKANISPTPRLKVSKNKNGYSVSKQGF